MLDRVTMTGADDIEPCPFCGSNKVRLINGSYVACNKCDAFGPSVGMDKKTELVREQAAVDLWNKRAETKT